MALFPQPSMSTPIIASIPNSRALGHILMPRIAQTASRIAPERRNRVLAMTNGGSSSRP
jgi:hypothetical protein